MEKKKRISDIITKEEASKWKIGSNILVAAPMGAGKSYFCKNTLYELAKEVNGKILMLIHRSNCVEQFKYEIERDGKADVIDVRTYQSLEYGAYITLKIKLICLIINILYQMNFIIFSTIVVSTIKPQYLFK